MAETIDATSTAGKCSSRNSSVSRSVSQTRARRVAGALDQRCTLNYLFMRCLLITVMKVQCILAVRMEDLGWLSWKGRPWCRRFPGLPVPKGRASFPGLLRWASSMQFATHSYFFPTFSGGALNILTEHCYYILAPSFYGSLPWVSSPRAEVATMLEDWAPRGGSF